MCPFHIISASLEETVLPYTRYQANDIQLFHYNVIPLRKENLGIVKLVSPFKEQQEKSYLPSLRQITDAVEISTSKQHVWTSLKGVQREFLFSF